MKIANISLKAGKKELPLVPLRELVVFPHMVVPFFAGRSGSIHAVEEAMRSNRVLFLACQKNNVDLPADDDIYEIGTISKILQMMRLPDGTLRVLVEGQERGIIQKYSYKGEMRYVRVRRIQEHRALSAQSTALMGMIQKAFKRYAKYQKKISPEVLASIEKAEYPDKLIDIVAANVGFTISKKIEILAKESPVERLEALAVSLESENEVLHLQSRINSRVRKKLERNQKEYFLNEQMKQIQKELGKEDEDPNGVAELARKIDEKAPPEEVRDKAERELARLARLQPVSPESAILRTYLEWIADLPWSNVSSDFTDIDEAAKILDEDHYDMKKAKERILDFIGVRQLKDKVKGPILCFLGPPGAGKTSLGRSVARALGREFVRISLGGVRDEAEIRGHRKTYVGALPGKIIQSMKRATTMNPVFLLDEVDKMSSDFRGDPAAALLEVLDPEQNSTFVDHYLELPYDLSGVMFITTANSLHNIPYALRDRMEIIEIPGYTDLEKEQIASRFILPKQLEANGLDWADIQFRSDTLMEIIHGYTMESGVRNLEREIATIIRKVAREAVKKGYTTRIQESPEEGEDTPEEFDEEEVVVASRLAELEEFSKIQETQEHSRIRRMPNEKNEFTLKPSDESTPGSAVDGDIIDDNAGGTVDDDAAEEPEPVKSNPPIGAQPGLPPFRRIITVKSLVKFLGPRKHQDDLVYKVPNPGLAHGLAWTENGGTLLPVEVAIIEGQGDLILTGSLGDVMKESARLGLSFIRVHNSKFRVPADFQKHSDIHIHVPEGAIPKDGPSAGITLLSAMLSALTDVPVRKGFAMTGEITLTGRMLPIGGVKEKVLAAYRNKMTHVLLPEGNRKDIEELPKEVQTRLEFIFTDSVMDALLILFPEATQDTDEEAQDRQDDESRGASSTPKAAS
jgi:ATP-dependent Lon protease